MSALELVDLPGSIPALAFVSIDFGKGQAKKYIFKQEKLCWIYDN
jgi:hypothetical protein